MISLVHCKALYAFLGGVVFFMAFRYAIWMHETGRSMSVYPGALYVVRACVDVPLFMETVNDINVASLEQLIAVPGIGQKTAERILGFIQSVGFILDMGLLRRPWGPLNDLQYYALSCHFTVFLGNGDPVWKTF